VIISGPHRNVNRFLSPSHETGQRKTFRIRLLLLPGLLLGSLAHASDAATDPLEAIGVLLEPRFAAPDIHHEIRGARETVLIPARRTAYGIDSFTEERWGREGLDWPEVLSAGMKRANELEEAMEIDWFRDDRRVIQYARVRSEDPFLSSVIFSPGFLDHFREKLGHQVLVVVPDRSSLFVFPRFGPFLDEFGPALVRRYREAVFKVSLEVFLISEDGPRAVGRIGS